jgi:WD40 repeat protein
LRELLVFRGHDNPSGHTAAVNAVCLSKEYMYVLCVVECMGVLLMTNSISASADRTLRVWCIRTGDLLASLITSSGIASIDYDPSLTPLGPGREPDEAWSKGTIIAGSSDATIIRYSLLNVVNYGQVSFSLFDDDEEDDEETVAVEMSEESQFWAPCTCPASRRQDLIKCRYCHNTSHTGLIRSLYLNHKVLLSASYDSAVKVGVDKIDSPCRTDAKQQVWNRERGELVMDLPGGHTGRVFAVVADRTRVVSSDIDCKIVVWDFGEGLDTAFIEP